MTDAERKLTFGQKMGYASGDFASCIFFGLFMAFLLNFYTDVFGISAAAAGTMLLVTRLWDMFFDPMMGTIADRTQTRWGKFRPYLVWMAIPFGVIGFFTFMTPNFGSVGKIVYAYITYTLMLTIYSAINIPYTALLGVLTPNSLDRTSISSFKFIGAFLGGFLIEAATAPLVKYFGGDNPITGYEKTVAIYAVIAIGMFFVAFATTKERVQPPKEQKTPLGQDLWDLLNNVPWVVLAFVGIFTLTWVSIRLGSTIFYLTYFVDAEALRAFLAPFFHLFGVTIKPEYALAVGISTFLIVGRAANILGVLFTKPLAQMFGKRATYIIAMAGNGLLMAPVFWLGPKDVGILFILHTISSVLSGPTSPLVWAMYADTADYGEWKFGRRATGLVFSAAVFAQKGGWSIGGFANGWLLAYYGYQANAIQSESALLGIRLMMSLIPAAGCLLAAGSVLFYKIGEDIMKQIEGELSARRAKGEAGGFWISLGEALKGAQGCVNPLKAYYLAAAVLAAAGVYLVWQAGVGLWNPRGLVILAAVIAFGTAFVYGYKIQAALHRTNLYVLRSVWLGRLAYALGGAFAAGFLFSLVATIVANGSATGMDLLPAASLGLKTLGAMVAALIALFPIGVLLLLSRVKKGVPAQA
jgi:GPH family glycoside/pentoside/hexuronide:cation symporter